MKMNAREMQTEVLSDPSEGLAMQRASQRRRLIVQSMREEALRDFNPQDAGLNSHPACEGED